ncbi:MAG: 30S ribosomal protein S6 [bacterium]|nr:30S ribosomal protein S6 [bacterium]
MSRKEYDKIYELGYLLVAAGAEAEVVGFLKAHKAEIVSQSPLSDVKLAYPIGKHEVAHFGFIHFKADPEDVNSIKKDAVLEKSMLRSLLIKATPVVPERRDSRPVASSQDSSEKPPAPATKGQVQPQVLSNEALEAKIEEILK